MATRGRLEGRVTVPTGGWTATVGGGTATIAAGNYYAGELLTAVGTAFGTAAGTTCVATASRGETGTGLVTLTFGSSKAVTWVSTDLRDVLGFTASMSAATSHVSSKQMRALWLPGCVYRSLNAVDADWTGMRESDARWATNAAGYSWTLLGSTKIANALSWFAVSRAKTWIGNEATGNQSFERFVSDCIWGEATWGNAGGPILFYPDADATLYATYMVPDAKDIRPTPTHDGWSGGPWRIELRRLVVVPGTAPSASVPVTIATLTTNSSTTDGTSFLTASIAPTAGRLVMVAVVSSRLSSATPQVPSGITGAGMTFVKAGESLFRAVIAANALSVWYAVANGSSGQLTISFGNTHGSCIWQVAELPNAVTTSSGADAIVQTNSAIAASPSSSVSTTLAAFGSALNLTYVAFGGNQATAYTATAPITLLDQDTETVPGCSLAVGYATASTTAGATATPTTGALGVVAIEVKAA